MGWLPGSPRTVTDPEVRLTRREAEKATYGIKAYRQRKGLILADTDAVPDHQAEVLAFEATGGVSTKPRPALASERQRQPAKQAGLAMATPDGRTRPQVTLPDPEDPE